MKKKGFTLIELLAVIVILAIIAVIIVPKIADMISSSRQGGAEDSFYGTLKAAELGYAKALQTNVDLKGSTCNIADSKITCTNGVKIDVSGKTPESGTLVIDSAGSTIAKALTLNGYKCYGDLSTENPCIKADVDVAAESLIKKVTTSGDGLYKDLYEEGRYVFRGKNPNNYITFNNETAGWRIVSVEADGTLKIIKNTNLKIDGGYTGPWDKVKNRSSKTSTYCTLAETYGCNIWGITNDKISNGVQNGTVIQNASLNNYLNGTYYQSLLSASKKYIMPHNFNTGFINKYDPIEKINEAEKKIHWKGYIGLINLSDYVKATLDNCDTSNIYNWNYTSPNILCKNQNWIYGYADLWTLTPTSISTATVIDIYNTGSINSYYASHNTERKTYPVVYLKANIELIGTGTNSDPYKIKQS